MKRRPWTAGDLTELRQRYMQGDTFSMIGEALGRSPGNCVLKASGMALPPRNRTEQARRGFENFALKLLQTGTGPS